MYKRQDETGSFWLKLLGIVVLLTFLAIGSIGVYRYMQEATPQDERASSQSQPDQAEMTPPAVPKSRDAITISIASSNTKQAWLHEVTERFNKLTKNDSALQVEGRPVYVEIIQETVDNKKVDYRSGTMVADVLSGKIKPTIVSPGEESWLENLNKEWQIKNGFAISKIDSPVLVRTPLVIAMWESKARALGAWPEAGPNCTWKEIRDLSVDPNGWARYGHPEWGKFKLGYGYFGESNSGTLGIISMAVVGSGKKTVTFKDINVDSPSGKFIADVEKAKVHSGKSDLWLLEKMISGGPEYLDGVITYESNVIQMNMKHAGNLRETLVCVYPQDGTIVVGHPFGILDKAPWVTPEQVTASKIYRDYLMDTLQQKAVTDSGLRPVDSSSQLSAIFGTVFGANPNTKLNVLEIPEQLVINRIGEVWHNVKKHAIIALVFDKSGSMGGSKMTSAIKGATEFVNLMDPDDQLLWMPFDSKPYGILAQGQKRSIGEKMVNEYIKSTTASGSTALYQTVLLAYDTLMQHRHNYGDTYRYGIVVLTDGRDESDGSVTLTHLEAKFKPLESDPTGIQIFTIGIGDAREDVLSKISTWAHGKNYMGTAENLTKIYREIATFY